MANCGTCSRELDVPGDPGSKNCGGDCLACVNEAEGYAIDSEAFRLAINPDFQDKFAGQWVAIKDKDSDFYHADSFQSLMDLEDQYNLFDKGYQIFGIPPKEKHEES